MTPDAVRELWVRFVAGEALPADEQAALVAALDADPALRAELLEDVQVDGALRAMGDARRSGAAFSASVTACVEPERDATRFVRKVEARLADLPPEPVGPGRESRSNLPRISRRFHRRDSESAGWKSGLAAAAAFIAIVLMATVFSSGPVKPPKPSPVVVFPKTAPLPKDAAPVEPGKAVETQPAPRPSPDTEPKRPSAPPDGLEFREPEPLEIPPPKAPDPSEPKTPTPPPAAVPAPPPTRSLEEAAIARGPKLASFQGQVYFADDQMRVPLDRPLAFGRDIYTVGRGSEAVLRYDDGTTVKVGPDSMVRDLSGSAGLKLGVIVGAIASDIRPQPAGRPMLFVTDHAVATIVGTRIRLTTVKDHAVGTTLDVEEGKVSFKRLSDDAVIEVTAGRGATATASREANWSARVTFPSFIKMNFGPANAKIPGWHHDAGQAFDPARGYGWEGPPPGSQTFTWVDNQGVKQSKRSGPEPVARSGNLPPASDPRATAVAGGWGEHYETWKIELPNGRYLVTVCVGDPTFDQGPHHVAFQGQAPLINQGLTTLPSMPFLKKSGLVDVKDGLLTMKIGGYPGPAKSPADNTKDTILNYLTIERVPAK